MADILPSQTLYINNLNEKIKKAPLKKAIYSAFSQFGRILEIVTLRGDKLRGQAWISFDTVEAATTAMAKFQGHPFFDKPLRIQYAKQKSDIIAKRDGSYKPREKSAVSEDTTAPASKPAAVAMDTSSTQEMNMTPSSILFAQNLPTDCTDAALALLFQVHAGFKEVRMVPGKVGIAFIEFDDEHKATTALQSLNGFKLTPTDTMALSYAKR
mmetsp:Transcript_51095/g.116165  ORF Transcript_51095/g.116165 Transcript_51095/m.116165 type:complete len:212 (+) Transcript_51095:48-683(+)